MALEIGEYKMRPLEERDLERVLAWRNSEKVRSKMLTDYIITIDEHRAWFERSKQNPIVTSYIFEYLNKPIGYIGYNDIDQKNSICSAGLYLGEEENLPISAGLALSFFTIEYAFRELKIRKQWGYIFNYNKKVVKLHKYLGFTQEGYLKRHVLKNGQYEDLVIMSIFKEDWESKRKEISRFLF